MKRVAAVIALLMLLLPATASAKGTDVRISSAPNGTEPGEPWFTRVTVTMPGNGRLGGIRPRVIIRRGAQRRSFPVVSTGQRGVFTARVVFPSRGTWRYGVHDDFGEFERGMGRVHWFPPVTIAAGQPKLGKAPRPVSGDISLEMEDAPRGQLPPETFRVASNDDDDSGSGALFPALAFLLAAGVAGPIWLRRRQNKKRAA